MTARRNRDTATTGAHGLAETLSGHRKALADFRSELEAKRERIDQAHRRLRELASVAPTESELRARAGGITRRLAAECKDGIRGLVSNEDEFSFSEAIAGLTRRGPMEIVGEGGVMNIVSQPAPTSALHYLATLFPSETEGMIFAAMQTALDQSDHETMSTEAVAAEREALRVEILRISVDEEMAIRAASDLGLSVQRRTDAAPEVVLAPTSELEAFLDR